jgi:hypothetical protein
MLEAVAVLVLVVGGPIAGYHVGYRIGERRDRLR